MRTTCHTCGSLLPPPPTFHGRRTVEPETKREDDSGIVDLRALRAAHEASYGMAATDARDRAAVLGRTPHGLGSSTLAPVVLSPGRGRGVDKPLVAAVVGGSALVASALVVAAAALGGPMPPPPPLVGAAPAVPEERPVAERPPAPADDSPLPNSAPPEPSEDDAQARNERTEASAEAKPRPRRTAPRPRRATAPAPRTTEPAQDARASSGNRLIDLVDKALQNPDGTAPALPDYPETPDRNAVARAFRSVDGRINACVDDASRGVLWVRATIVGETGRVRRATVKGEYAGTTAGACAVRVIRQVAFPRFTRETLDVEFPFSIR